MKVIATYGPKLVETGKLDAVCNEADVIRINISHQLADEAEKTFNLLRPYGKPIMIDTSGPEVRIKARVDAVDLQPGDEISFGPDEDFDFDQNMFPHLEVGDSIYVDDGIIELKLVEKTDKRMKFKAVEPVTIKNKKGVNLRGRSFQFPILKPNDEEVLKRVDPEFVALSYTRNVEDIRTVRKLTKAKIIAKIENWEGVQNIESIIRESDGVMVARGDLGVETPPENVPVIQKQIVKLANKYAKPVIVATQVLYSMVENPVPTRAEVSDIATAVLDGADAIMLSNETAVGKFPVEAIKVVKKVSKNVMPYVNVEIKETPESIDHISDALSRTLYYIVSHEKIDRVIVMTRSGFASRLVSRFKLPKPVIAFTEDDRVAREMALQYNVIPQLWKRPDRHMVPAAAKLALEKGLVKEDDTVVFTAAVRTSKPGGANLVEVHKISDLLTSSEN